MQENSVDGPHTFHALMLSELDHRGKRLPSYSKDEPEVGPDSHRTKCSRQKGEEAPRR